MKDTKQKKVFGEALSVHLASKGRIIAAPLQLAVTELLKDLHEIGLFRVGPGLTKLRRVKAELDAGVPISKIRKGLL